MLGKRATADVKKHHIIHDELRDFQSKNHGKKENNLIFILVFKVYLGHQWSTIQLQNQTAPD